MSKKMENIKKNIYLLYMSNIKVIDVNEEVKQEAVEEPPVIEEATEQIEQEHEVSCSIREPTNEVVDAPATEEEAKEVVEKPKAKAKPKPTDKVDCKTCGKTLSYKNYRYRHEKICSEEPKPVKPQANPKGKSKPKAQPIIQDVEEEIHEVLPSGNPQQTQPVKKQILKPTNPLTDARQSLASIRDITNHYAILQQQYIQQKQAKYQNLCQNMFAPKSKKR